MHWWHVLQHWLAVHTGTVNEPGVWYGFWSGFGADIGEYVIFVALVAGIYHSFRRHNCHEPRCWRIGLHPVPGTPYIACKHHHPVLLGNHHKPGHMTVAYNRANPELAAAAEKAKDAKPASS
jgi:hypothetical protein